MCRRQFDRKKSLNAHCCSSVQFEPPIKKSNGKRNKGTNSQAKSAERKGGKRDGWSQEEESLLETGVMEFGNNWTLILYKYGSSFRLEHQHPTILSAKWDDILKKKDADIKPFPQAPENDENDNEDPDVTGSAWPDSSIAADNHFKPLVIVTPQNRERKKRSAEEEDEDYVPELGADSDSDCSDVANKQEYDRESPEEEEELSSEEEEEEGAPSTEKPQQEASFRAVSQSEEAPSFSLFLHESSLSSPSFALPISAVQPDAGNPSSSIVEAAAAAAGLSADDNPATPATYYQLLTEDGGTTAYAIPVAALSQQQQQQPPPWTDDQSVLQLGKNQVVVESASASSTASTTPPSDLPQPFQNLINSEDYQRLLQVPVDEVLGDRTAGSELLQAVLSELARILASVYPGHKNVAAASKFSDSVCVPWLRTFLPHLCSLPETREVLFDGQEVPRPVLSAIQAKVKSIFLFYLEVLPPSVAGIR